MTEKTFRRNANRTPPPPVPIRPLVVLDFLVGGLLLLGGVINLMQSAQAGGTAAAGNAIGGAVTLLMGAGVIAIGAILFTRQLWAYWVSLVVHALMLLYFLGSIVLVMVVFSRFGPGVPMSAMMPVLGCFGFIILLFALCVHHAWKLIKADTKRKDEIRLAAEEAEIDVQPGWDEDPTKK